MKKAMIIATMLFVALALTGCTTSEPSTLASVGLEGLTAKEILLGVESGSIAVEGFGLSVYDDELIVIVEDEKISLPMPTDKFYVSVAPYLEDTHKCYFHSATGCRGEMKSETFHFTYIDLDGNVIVDQDMQTMANGFIDLWLPRNIEGTLTITQGDFVATKTLTTYAGDPTCETTMKLQ